MTSIRLPRADEVIAPSSLCVSGDQREVAAHHGAFVVVWDVATGEIVRRSGRSDQPMISNPHLAWNPTAPVMASADGADIVLLDAANFAEQGRLRGHTERAFRTGGVTALAFSSDGGTLASAGIDGTVRLWDLASRMQRDQWESPGAAITWLQFSQHGALVMANRNDPPVVWDHTEVSTLPITLALESTWSPDGSRLAFGDWQGGLHVADASGETIASIHSAHRPLLGVWVDETVVATTERRDGVLRWDVGADTAEFFSHGLGATAIRALGTSWVTAHVSDGVAAWNAAGEAVPWEKPAWS